MKTFAHFIFNVQKIADSNIYLNTFIWLTTIVSFFLKFLWQKLKCQYFKEISFSFIFIHFWYFQSSLWYIVSFIMVVVVVDMCEVCYLIWADHTQLAALIVSDKLYISY